MILQINASDHNLDYTSSIVSALDHATLELSRIEDNLESLHSLQPQCDKLDYALAASSGAICGIIDIFLVGKPGESSLGDITDKWFEDRTMDFAKRCGWGGSDDKPLSSAIRFLEKTFKIPYDQRGLGDAASFIFDLNAKNHHFKSLAHNPSLCGLFFSILDQFSNSSHFISGGELISLQDADGKFELQGHDVPSKLFCAFVNWFGHLISDMSGSSGSKGRGMGVPSPLWTWTNSLIALKKSLQIPVNQFDHTLNELALKLYSEGFDARFQSAQILPVFINEMIVRLCYSVRRLIKYYVDTDESARSFACMWKACEPFSNPTVKRMLTVAHGTFCLLDISDATARGLATGAGSFNPTEFFLRINVAGVGRFTISLYGEAKRGIHHHRNMQSAWFLTQRKQIVESYIDGLQILAVAYNDHVLVKFIEDFASNPSPEIAFYKSVQLAELRNVPDSEVLKSKADIDAYFSRRDP